MTIFRSSVAIPMLRDVFATWDDWHGELQTVTGYSWEEYEVLFAKLPEKEVEPLSSEEEFMLRQAANQFFGYPVIRTANLEAAFGDVWRQRLSEAFREKGEP